VPAAVVTERLHRRVIDHPHRTGERLGEVESDPTGTQIVRLGDGVPAPDWPGIANSDGVVLPVCGDPSGFRYHLGGRHARS